MDREGAAIALAGLAALLLGVGACGQGQVAEEPAPATGFGVLSGQTVLVLPVQYVRQVPGGWVAGAANATEAARAADSEIAFALAEQGGRAIWVTAEQQVEALRRRPGIQGVNPYVLSADEARRGGGKLRSVHDPLYGEIRMVAALFDARYALLPLEFFYQPGEGEAAGRLALRTFLLDTRAGTVLWYGVVTGGDDPPASAAALASLAQAFAGLVSP